MRVSPLDVTLFALELLVYAAVAWAVCLLLPGTLVAGAGAVGAVLLMATWWGLLHSPKAPLHAPGPLGPVLRASWFGVGLLAALTALAA